MNKITTEINEKWIDEEGILRMKVLEGVEITTEKLKADLLVNNQLTHGKRVRVLYDARPHFMITLEARELLQSKAFNANRIATAVISNKLGVRLMVNFMTKFKKTESPLQFFSNETKALAWLRKFDTK